VLHTACTAENKNILGLLLEKLNKEVHEEDKRLDIVNEKYDKQTAVDCLYGHIDVVDPIVNMVKGVMKDSHGSTTAEIEKRLADLQAMYNTLSDYGAKASLLTAAL
jgi:hypothetical protein